MRRMSKRGNSKQDSSESFTSARTHQLATTAFENDDPSRRTIASSQLPSGKPESTVLGARPPMKAKGPRTSLRQIRLTILILTIASLAVLFGFFNRGTNDPYANQVQKITSEFDREHFFGRLTRDQVWLPKIQRLGVNAYPELRRMLSQHDNIVEKAYEEMWKDHSPSIQTYFPKPSSKDDHRHAAIRLIQETGPVLTRPLMGSIIKAFHDEPPDRYKEELLDCVLITLNLPPESRETVRAALNDHVSISIIETLFQNSNIGVSSIAQSELEAPVSNKLKLIKDEILPNLEAALANGTNSDQISAASHILVLEPDHRGARSQLQLLMQDANAFTSTEAAYAFWRATTEADEAIQVYRRVLRDERWARGGCFPMLDSFIERLEEMGPAATPIAGDLAALIYHPVPAIRYAAADALLNIDPSLLPPIIEN